MSSAVGIVTFVTIVLHQSDYEQYLWISIMVRMAWITVSKEYFPLWQNEKKWYLAKLYFFDMIVNPISCVVIFWYRQRLKNDTFVVIIILITYRYIPFLGTLDVPTVAPETEKVPYTLQVRNTSLFPIIEMIGPSEFCTMTLEYWEYLLFEIFRVFVPFI